MMNAELAEGIVFGIFHLPIHPDVVLVPVIIQTLVGRSVVLALTGHYDVRKRLQLAVGSGRHRPDGQCSSGQFLR